MRKSNQKMYIAMCTASGTWPVYGKSEMRALFIPKPSWFAWHLVMKIQLIWLQILQWTHTFYPTKGLIQQKPYTSNMQLMQHVGNSPTQQFWKPLLTRYQSPGGSINPVVANLNFPSPYASSFFKYRCSKRKKIFGTYCISKPIQVPVWRDFLFQNAPK